MTALGERLRALEAAGLLRDDEPPLPAPGEVVLCSNDYLGFAEEPWPGGGGAAGAGASRLVSGDHRTVRSAEAAIAEWLGEESCLLFTSGYAANVGAIPALAGPGDVVFSDALNHASIIDGCRLSRAEVVVVPHLDLAALESGLTERRGNARWVVTETCFSMDGDAPDLRALRGLCDRYGAALYVDEAHALGVRGPAGTGLCGDAGVRAEVRVGTLGKALGLQGAFVVGSRELRQWLWNRARSFVFSTGIAPALAEATLARVREVARDDARRRALHAATVALRAGLAEVPGVRPGAPESPIVPWVIGEPRAAVLAARRLRERGVFAQAIRPPTVPEGTARIRFAAHARLTEPAIERAVGAVREVAAGGE